MVVELLVATLWWTNILPWKITMLLMGKSTISMAIFHSFLYVHQRLHATCSTCFYDHPSSGRPFPGVDVEKFRECCTCCWDKFSWSLFFEGDLPTILVYVCIYIYIHILYICIYCTIAELMYICMYICIYVFICIHCTIAELMYYIYIIICIIVLDAFVVYSMCVHRIHNIWTHTLIIYEIHTLQ